MAITTGTVTPLLTEGIRKIIGDAFRRYPLEFSQYLNVNSSRKNFEFDRETVGLGSLATKAENAPIAMLDPLVGREKRYTHQTFAAGVRVSWEAQDDELYGFINRVMNSLGSAANETMNIEGAGVFNLADSGDTGALTGFDTNSLLNTAHTHPAAASMTYTSNRLSLDLSESALQTALIQFETVQDAVDNRITFGKPNKLVIAPDNMFLVREILLSEGKPFTADNTTNVLRGIITPIILHFATDVDRWLILAQDHDLNWFMRVPPVMDRYDDKSTKSMVVTIAGRWSRGFGEWRPVVGSPGVP
jgi:hypothetical protein